MPADGAICMSRKVLAKTPDAPLEPGRNRLACPGQSTDIQDFPGARGPVDLTRYPPTPGHEDFVTMIEAPGARFGWTALIRDTDIVFVIKDPRELPVTMLWFSNGGRDHAPWNGRHLGVLGVEDARVPTGETGVSDGLRLTRGRTHVVHHIIGAIARPKGWNRVTGIRPAGGELMLTGDDDARVFLPFKTDFFGSD